MGLNMKVQRYQGPLGADDRLSGLEKNPRVATIG